MNTKDKGDLSESRAITEMLERGFSVSVPFGDNDSYDLIADSGEELLRVQVKTGWVDKHGRMKFKTYSKTTKDGETHRSHYDEDDIDAFVVYCPDTKCVYWVDIEEATKSSMQLRVEDPDKPHPSIRWAEDYRIENQLKSRRGVA